MQFETSLGYRSCLVFFFKAPTEYGRDGVWNSGRTTGCSGSAGGRSEEENADFQNPALWEMSQGRDEEARSFHLNLESWSSGSHASSPRD